MKKLAAFVFPGFQTLDYFGPVEMLGDGLYDIEVVTVAQTNAPVPSRHGQRLHVDKTCAEQDAYDLVLIPGGDAALTAAQDPELLEWIRTVSATAERVMAVCTGTILLGMSGALDGRKATTNKLDFLETIHHAPKVEWVRQARWVQDGKFYTSSGVSAGMDMALAVLADLYGVEKAEITAETSEYIWTQDPQVDPFAQRAGLLNNV